MSSHFWEYSIGRFCWEAQCSYRPYFRWIRSEKKGEVAVSDRPSPTWTYWLCGVKKRERRGIRLFYLFHENHMMIDLIRCALQNLISSKLDYIWFKPYGGMFPHGSYRWPMSDQTRLWSCPIVFLWFLDWTFLKIQGRTGQHYMKQAYVSHCILLLEDNLSH